MFNFGIAAAFFALDLLLALAFGWVVSGVAIDSGGDLASAPETPPKNDEELEDAAAIGPCLDTLWTLAVRKDSNICFEKPIVYEVFFIY